MSTQEIRADIETTRAELGETVQQLAERVDVKTRAQAKLGDIRQRAVRAAHRPTPYLWMAGLASVVGAVVFLRRWWSR